MATDTSPASDGADAPAPRRRRVMRRVRVTRVEQLSPRMVRVTFMRRIRKHLLHDRGLDPATIVTRGYWKLGTVDYTDHDYGTDG